MYQKTINLWEGDTTQRILDGDLVLQCGQWVSCGGGEKSRFIGVNGVCLDVVHYPDTCKAKFRTRAFLARMRNNDQLSSAERVRLYDEFKNNLK